MTYVLLNESYLILKQSCNIDTVMIPVLLMRKNEAYKEVK